MFYWFIAQFLLLFWWYWCCCNWLHYNFRSICPQESKQSHLKGMFSEQMFVYCEVKQWKWDILSSFGSVLLKLQVVQRCSATYTLCLSFSTSFSSCTSSSSLSVIGCNPPDLHRDRFDDVRDPVLSPGVPQDVRPLAPVQLDVLRGAVEVCQATLVEPPARLVVLSAAALHRAVVDGAERITAVVVHIWGAEWSRVLVLLLLVATKCIACTKQHTQKCTEACRCALFPVCTSWEE